MKAVLEDGKLLVPKTWESPGIYGDGYVELDPSDPEYDEWMADVSHSANVWEMTAASWDPAKHPHEPGGSSKGGQWAETNGQTTLLEPEPESAAPVMGLGPPGRAEAMAAQANAPTRDEQIDIEKRLRVFLDEAPLMMRVPESAMTEVFLDGEFYNQHQSGEARGMARDVKSEASMLGVPDFESVGPEDLPKYGYLGADTDQTDMYGPIKITFKDEVKDRATFTMGDSLMEDPLPSAIRDPRWQSANGHDYDDYWEVLNEGAVPYVEAQIYGKLTPDDIESVEVLDESYWEDEDPLTGMPLVSNVGQMGAVLDELTRRKIPWSTFIPEGDYSGEFA